MRVSLGLCLLQGWRNPQPAWLDTCWSIRLGIPSQLQMNKWGKKCRSKLWVDQGKKSDCPNEKERMLVSISTICKPSWGTQSGIRPKPALCRSSNGKEDPRTGAESGYAWAGSNGIYLKACRRQDKEPRGGRKRQSVMFRRSRSEQVPRRSTSSQSVSYFNNSALGTAFLQRAWKSITGQVIALS